MLRGDHHLRQTQVFTGMANLSSQPHSSLPPQSILFSHSHCHTFDFIITLITLFPLSFPFWLYFLPCSAKKSQVERKMKDQRLNGRKRVDKRSGRRQGRGGLSDYEQRGDKRMKVSEQKQLWVLGNRHRNCLEL